MTVTKVFGCSTKWSDKADDVTRWMDKVRQEPVKREAADAAALKALRANQETGKVRLINVWGGPCVSEFGELLETNLRFRHRDFELETAAA